LIIGPGGSVTENITSEASHEEIFFYVNGCLQLLGVFNIIGNYPFSTPEQIMPLVGYQPCNKRDVSKRSTLTADQIYFLPNYPGGECDQYSIETYDGQVNGYIVAYAKISYTGNKCQTSSTSAEPDRDAQVSKGTIVGLAVGLGGGLLMVACVIAIAIIFYKRKQQVGAVPDGDLIDNPSFKSNDIEMN